MVHVKHYSTIPFTDHSQKEIVRYSGARECTPELEQLISLCAKEMNGRLRYSLCYSEFSVSAKGDTLDLGFAKVTSKDLAKNLSGCKKIIVFAATVGIDVDRLISRYSHTSPSRALVYQAIGAERIEALCDTFCKEIALSLESEGATTRPRFSPGYGDLPLSLQRQIFSTLDCHTRIGLALGENLLMSPSKSVTAIIGILEKK